MDRSDRASYLAQLNLASNALIEKEPRLCDGAHK